MTGPRFKPGDRVCAPDVAGLDPFTVCLVTSAPLDGVVDLVEDGPEQRVHLSVPLDHVVHI